MRITQLHSFLASVFMLISSCCFSSVGTDGVFSVQVIRQQLVFNLPDIESATVVKQSDNNYGVRIKLTSKAADELLHMTNANAGSTVNIVHDKKIISTVTITTGLAGEFVVTGMTESEAKKAARNMSH